MAVQSNKKENPLERYSSGFYNELNNSIDDPVHQQFQSQLMHDWNYLMCIKTRSLIQNKSCNIV